MTSVWEYEEMRERPDALERLDLRIRWGPYEIQVLRFHLTQFPPGHMIAFHKHAEFEFHYIPKGKGKVILVDQEFPLGAGQLYLTGPGVLHYQEADRHEAMDELCLHLDIIERGEEQTADDWEHAEAVACVKKLIELPLVPAQDLHEAMPCFLEAYRACSAGYSGSYTTIKQIVIQILLRTVRAYDAAGSSEQLPTKDMKSYRYELALEFLRANYAETVTLEDVAERLWISPRQLQRLFKEQSQGHSFTRILEDTRLAAVCRELTDTDLSIEQIALRTGFATGNYLHAVFRKRYGMTPSDYRKSNLLGGITHVQNV
ncbi:helix-turn-helix domain-containing protein [Paenibacillus soyae]|uniref:Helix-turn-helix domain-containing protein n=1 Tax=Paenibacillus soyae TaxID=2969249 RepID=A0A9X2S9Q3_9BACL|nr:helix-turn-helix domain-containing protein [Paenibacillus soyae]MCR2803828.1 helix-turn-helix domain-containing protein [Paenibacillus soyae]